jgi:hypothetical protein
LHGLRPRWSEPHAPVRAGAVAGQISPLPGHGAGGVE